MFAWKASTENSPEPGAAFPAARGLQPLAAPFSGVALTHLPLRLQLSGQLPGRQGLRCASGRGLAVKLTQETSPPSRWGQGHKEGGPITVSYIQIMLTVLLQPKHIKGKSGGPLSSCKTLDKAVSLEEPRFPHLQIGENNIYINGPEERRCMKQLAPCPTPGKCSVMAHSSLSPQESSLRILAMS